MDPTQQDFPYLSSATPPRPPRKPTLWERFRSLPVAVQMAIVTVAGLFVLGALRSDPQQAVEEQVVSREGSIPTLPEPAPAAPTTVATTLAPTTTTTVPPPTTVPPTTVPPTTATTAPPASTPAASSVTSPPRTAAAAPAQSEGGCHSSYRGACVPIASDVDCGGGSGNGPAYVYAEDFSVVGPDVYDLDRDGDGIACES